MTKKLVLMCLAVLLLSTSSFAGADSSKTFLKAVGSVQTAQDRDIEDVAFLTRVDVVRLLPWVPWYIGGVAEYSRVEVPGKDEVDVSGQLIVFSGDPNGPERDGNWLAFLTVGGIKLHDNDGVDDPRVIPTNTSGSLGVIGPIGGVNWVLELGAKRMLNPLGETETYWSLGLGFLGMPKLKL